MCNRFGQVRHVGLNKCPCAVRMLKAERMRSHEFEEKRSKTSRKRENNYSKSFV